MDNIDWTIHENEAMKIFSLLDEKSGERFVREVRKLGRRENHQVKLRRLDDHNIRVRMPVEDPGKYSEKEIRLLNLINKLGQ